MKLGFLLALLVPIAGQAYVSWRVWQLLPCAAALKATVVVLITRLLTPSPGKTLRLKRLHRIGIMSAVLYCTSAAMLFLPRLSTRWALSLNGNEWVAFLLAGAVMHLYASWVTERELAKS